MNKCECGGTLCINVGDSIINGTFRWYASYHCNSCEISTEIDGNEIDSIPDDIMALMIKRGGKWGLASSSSNIKIKYLLKKILKNYDALILSENIFYCGTKNQVRWVKSKLIQKGISKDSLMIKNLSDIGENSVTVVNELEMLKE